MPIPASDPSIGAAAKQITEQAGTVAKSTARALVLGIGAALIVLYGLGFLFATIAVALAIVLDAWLALLVVTLGLFAIAALLGSMAKARLSSDSGTAKQELEAAVEQLRDGLGDAVAGKLNGRLPVVAAGALGAGFFLAGGIGATMRFLARKGRER